MARSLHTLWLFERAVSRTRGDRAVSQSGIRRGLEEALAYAEGTADTSRYGVHIPENIDVKAIRAKLNMTQEEFAGHFGFSINTLRHWDRAAAYPKGPPAPISSSSTATPGPSRGR
jgi:putative transcriptional regulator